ncbi:MAG TPA: ATP-binding cassette domain-containing protein [Acidimicrobiales bacterium]|nr:ATP-binding cassette domain-containing protein [Acidimicrobiales bacterium]
MARAILEVRDLWVGDGPGAAVQGVSFTVGPGQVFGVLGGPEAGKSRLLRCVGLDYPPTAGGIYFRGDEISGVGPDRRRQIRARDIELVHPPAPEGTRDSTVERGRSALLVAPRRQATVPVAGMRQRIQIAKALTNGTQVLLLDEPFAGVEPQVRRRIEELLQRLREEVGAAVVIATRDPEVCGRLAHDLLVLRDGEPVDRGTTTGVLEQPADARRWGLAEERRTA